MAKNYKPTIPPKSVPEVKRSSGTPVKFHADLRLLAKRANQAMVRLERLDINAPAYEYAQAVLEMLGKEAKGNRGRRFSETGKATYNEYQMLKSRLEKFLNMETHSEKGAKQWVEKIWQGALKSDKINIKDSNISRSDWLEFWKQMPNRQRDRMLGSEVIVNLLRTASLKNERLKEENRLTPEEIARAIQDSTDVKSAYKSLGITSKEYFSVVNIGSLPKPKSRQRAKR